MYLCFAAHNLAKFSSNPGKVHIESLVHFLIYGYLYGHGGGSEILFLRIHEFLICVNEKYVILKLSVCFMQ